MYDRVTKTGAFLSLRNLGFQPQLVFDVGAHTGTFELYECFPEAAHLLIEPIQEHEPALKELCAKIPQATYMIAAAADYTGTTNLQVDDTFTRSTMREDGDSVKPSPGYTMREVATIALDDLIAQSQLEGPFLLKIDVDGSEIDVLKGARSTLKHTEYAIIEVTLFGQLYDVMDFMREQGFVAYDIIEPLYRPSDNALWQVDMAFVKEDSFLRKHQGWG